MEIKFPEGWDETKVQRVLEHYESQSDDEAALEDDTAFHRETVMEVPRELVPAFREMIARYRKAS